MGWKNKINLKYQNRVGCCAILGDFRWLHTWVGAIHGVISRPTQPKKYFESCKKGHFGRFQLTFRGLDWLGLGLWHSSIPMLCGTCFPTQPFLVPRTHHIKTCGRSTIGPSYWRGAHGALAWDFLWGSIEEPATGTDHCVYREHNTQRQYISSGGLSQPTAMFQSAGDKVASSANERHLANGHTWRSKTV